VSSPSLSVASWSDLNAVYQENSAATLEVVNNVVNSPHNTWNYPSPGSPHLQYPPGSTSSPVVPWSPTIATSPELPFEFTIPGFPFLEPTGPGPYDQYIPQSPQYSTLSTSTGITLVNCYSSFDLSSIYAVKYHLTTRIRLYQLSFLISTIPGPRYRFPTFSDLPVI